MTGDSIVPADADLRQLRRQEEALLQQGGGERSVVGQYIAGERRAATAHRVQIRKVGCAAGETATDVMLRRAAREARAGQVADGTLWHRAQGSHSTVLPERRQ